MTDSRSEETTRKTPQSEADVGSHAMTPPEGRLSPGVRERYLEIHEIGRGGMGVVYRARDRETNEIVALKVLAPEIANDPDLIDRFKQELVLARKVTHPNVCRVHELLRFEGTTVISMEYVQGESLRQTLRRCGPISVRKGIEWARQICAGLAAAHTQGVVHRDLKPDNIQITPDGSAKIMDFGIARSVDTGKTHTRALIGTPAYMSPEQAQGEAVGARSDIYSLGLILYEMFTGEPAFRADTALALLAKRESETPPSPSKVEPYVPDFLSGAILKCLEKKPGDRFQELAELETALSGKAPIPTPRRGWWRTIRLVAAGAIATLLLVAGFFAIRQPPPLGMHHNRAVNCVVFSADGRMLASGSEDKTIKVWDAATQKETCTLTGHSRAVTAVAFSPDGKYLASASVDRTVRLWDLGGNRKESVLGRHSRAAQCVSYSPDGELVASGGDDGRVFIWEMPSGRELRTLVASDSGGINWIAFSPDSHLLATASDDETVGLWDAATGKELSRMEGHSDTVQVVAFSPDGRWLASGSLDGTIRTWAVDSGRPVDTVQVDQEGVTDLSFNPNGRWLAAVGESGTATIWDVARWQKLRTLGGESNWINTAAFSPNGKSVATGSREGLIRVWSSDSLGK